MLFGAAEGLWKCLGLDHSLFIPMLDQCIPISEIDNLDLNLMALLNFVQDRDALSALKDGMAVDSLFHL